MVRRFRRARTGRPRARRVRRVRRARFGSMRVGAKSVKRSRLLLTAPGYRRRTRRARRGRVSKRRMPSKRKSDMVTYTVTARLPTVPLGLIGPADLAPFPDLAHNADACVDATKLAENVISGRLGMYVFDFTRMVGQCVPASLLNVYREMRLKRGSLTISRIDRGANWGSYGSGGVSTGFTNLGVTQTPVILHYRILGLQEPSCADWTPAKLYEDRKTKHRTLRVGRRLRLSFAAKDYSLRYNSLTTRKYAPSGDRDSTEDNTYRRIAQPANERKLGWRPTADFFEGVPTNAWSKTVGFSPTTSPAGLTPQEFRIIGPTVLFMFEVQGQAGLVTASGLSFTPLSPVMILRREHLTFTMRGLNLQNSPHVGQCIVAAPYPISNVARTVPSIEKFVPQTMTVDVGPPIDFPGLGTASTVVDYNLRQSVGVLAPPGAPARPFQ